MVKFLAAGEKVNIVGLGLTEENLNRLKKGQPIKFKLNKRHPHPTLCVKKLFESNFPLLANIGNGEK